MIKGLQGPGVGVLVLLCRVFDGLHSGWISALTDGFLLRGLFSFRLLRCSSLLVRELLTCSTLVRSAHILSLRWFGWTHLLRVAARAYGEISVLDPCSWTLIQSGYGKSSG